jgi:hypothetical protein
MDDPARDVAEETHKGGHTVMEAKT